MAQATKARKATNSSRRGQADGPSPEQKIVDSLILLIEQGVSPWQRPWITANSCHHQNLITGHRYSGSNPALLEFQMAGRHSDLPLWAGFAQAKAKGWNVKKGSKGCYAIRPQLNTREVEDDNGKPVIGEDGKPQVTAWTSYKPVCLFNAVDLEGEGLKEAIDSIIGSTESRPDIERIAQAERVLNGWHETTECKLQHRGSQAFYVPASDLIVLPERQAFHTAEGFYSTWAHEIIHSTGHSLRLKRDLSGRSGTANYAREELVAELGSFLLTRRLEIGSQVENHASYLSHWASILKEGPKVLFKVLSDATKAANLVLPDAHSEA
jgi:antirestriction protein ArdC